MTVRGNCDAGRGLGYTCRGTLSWSVNCPNQCSSVSAWGEGSNSCIATNVSLVNCNYWGTNDGILFKGHYLICDTQCEKIVYYV